MLPNCMIDEFQKDIFTLEGKMNDSISKQLTMRQSLYIGAFVLGLMACNQNDPAKGNQQHSDTLNKSTPADTAGNGLQKPAVKRLSFQNVQEIVADSAYNSTWVKLNGDTASLALHFLYKDTLAISYSPECWLMYPYKADSNKIVVYWDNNIDTKYNFDIVKAINKTDKKLTGKPFMVLELENDTTLKATYLMKDLIKRINSSGKERTFFPDKYMIAQDGYL